MGRGRDGGGVGTGYTWDRLGGETCTTRHDPAPCDVCSVDLHDVGPAHVDPSHVNHTAGLGAGKLGDGYSFIEPYLRSSVNLYTC